MARKTATEGDSKAPVNETKNFSNSSAFRLSVCTVRGWQSPLRHHSPLVVVAPGPNAPVFFAPSATQSASRGAAAGTTAADGMAPVPLRGRAQRADPL